MKLGGNLSKREHQIMDLAYERGSIGSGELEELLPGRPSFRTRRSGSTFFAHSEAKGLFGPRRGAGPLSAGRPTRPREAVVQRRNRAPRVSTFFGGSVTAAVSTLLDQEKDQLTAA